jgi:hypothetical protein
MRDAIARIQDKNKFQGTNQRKYHSGEGRKLMASPWVSIHPHLNPLPSRERQKEVVDFVSQHGMVLELKIVISAQEYHPWRFCSNTVGTVSPS